MPQVNLLLAELRLDGLHNLGDEFGHGARPAMQRKRLPLRDFNAVVRRFRDLLKLLQNGQAGGVAGNGKRMRQCSLEITRRVS